MPPFGFAFLAFVAILSSGLAGLAFARAWPDSHVSGPSRDMIAGAAGLVGLLLALTLAMLILGASNVTQAQKAELRRLSAEALALNAVLKSYGSEAAEPRRLLGAEFALTDAALRGRPVPPGPVVANIEAMQTALGALKPATEAQRQNLAEAARLYAEVAQGRLALALPVPDPVSGPLMLALVTWSCLVFAGLGVLSRTNASTLAALALGGAGVASAIYLVLELSQPLSGSFRLSPGLISQTVMEIAQ